LTMDQSLWSELYTSSWSGKLRWPMLLLRRSAIRH
jgi:hypothetical protein